MASLWMYSCVFTRLCVHFECLSQKCDLSIPRGMCIVVKEKGAYFSIYHGSWCQKEIRVSPKNSLIKVISLTICLPSPFHLIKNIFLSLGASRARKKTWAFIWLLHSLYHICESEANLVKNSSQVRPWSFHELKEFAVLKRKKEVAIRCNQVSSDQCLIWALSNGALNIWATVWVSAAWPLCTRTKLL